MSAPSPAVWLVGCGNMGGAMLRRWIDCGTVEAERVTVIDPGARDLPERVERLDELPSLKPDFGPDILVLAVKPQQLGQLASRLAKVKPPLLVSILAGVEEATLAATCAAGAVVRAMPNLPVGIGKGVVALHSASADPARRDPAEALMAPLGLVEWIGDESLFDAVTALSGCGPGFVYRFIDALAAAGAALGLPDEQARRLAVATVEGSALLAAQSPESPATLADRVASPGGSTRVGLNILDDGDALKALLRKTLAASARRNAEMAAEARK